MAMHKRHMMTIIKRNGHLQMDGTETTEELRTALLFLRQHTYGQCKMPVRGIPIESLLPDVSVLAISPRSRNTSSMQ